MRFPEHLQPGGTIGFLAPSFGCATEPYKTAFLQARENFKSKGYRLLDGPNCYAAQGIGISNTPEKCGAEVLEMFASAADVLISCGGGELMCEILPYVDFDRLAQQEPKWFMGYSDNTNLTYLLATLADTASVYGPCAASFGMQPLHASLDDAFRVLSSPAPHTVRSYGMWEKESKKDEEHPLEPYYLTEELSIRRFVGKRELAPEEKIQFSGRLLGGCMDTLVTLLGTRFDRTADFVKTYREDGILWFLEACDLNVFSIRRAMWQMEEAGWFRYVKGFLFGRPGNGEPFMGLDACQAVMEIAGRKGVPVLLDVDLGHRPPMMPLVTGSLATVESVGNSLSVHMEYR